MSNSNVEHWLRWCGRNLSGFEEEGAVGHVIEWDNDAFSVGHFVILAMRVCHTRWVTRVKEMSLPYRLNGQGTCTAHHLAYGHHELDKSDSVTYGVVKTYGEDESTALEARNLLGQINTMLWY